MKIFQRERVLSSAYLFQTRSHSTSIMSEVRRKTTPWRAAMFISISPNTLFALYSAYLHKKTFDGRLYILIEFLNVDSVQ